MVANILVVVVSLFGLLAMDSQDMNHLELVKPRGQINCNYLWTIKRKISFVDNRKELWFNFNETAINNVTVDDE